MSILEAAKVLAKHGSFWRGRGQTGYGEVFECTCCSHAMNAGDRTHAPDCKVTEALKVVKETEEQ